MRNLITAILIVVSAGSAYAQGSAGTGSTSTGIGPQTGPAGPGNPKWRVDPTARGGNEQ
jgi:hypothetical protein